MENMLFSLAHFTLPEVADGRIIHFEDFWNHESLIVFDDVEYAELPFRDAHNLIISYREQVRLTEEQPLRNNKRKRRDERNSQNFKLNGRQHIICDEMKGNWMIRQMFSNLAKAFFSVVSFILPRKTMITIEKMSIVKRCINMKGMTPRGYTATWETYKIAQTQFSPIWRKWVSQDQLVCSVLMRTFRCSLFHF